MCSGFRPGPLLRHRASHKAIRCRAEEFWHRGLPLREPPRPFFSSRLLESHRRRLASPAYEQTAPAAHDRSGPLGRKHRADPALGTTPPRSLANFASAHGQRHPHSARSPSPPIENYRPPEAQPTVAGFAAAATLAPQEIAGFAAPCLSYPFPSRRVSIAPEKKSGVPRGPGAGNPRLQAVPTKNSALRPHADA